jgi:hypothetical protein
MNEDIYLNMMSDKYMVDMLTDTVDKIYNCEKINRLTYDEYWCLKEFLRRIEKNLDKIDSFVEN